ncbi:MAG: response regulator transcription factor [Chloroflexi bacterium]|nr:response regulator transcription factor [Chloroflexota bacterium]
MLPVTNPIRILIVDDDQQIQRAFDAALSSADNIKIVGRASNGLEAVDQFEALQPDLVLMDIMMPLVNGIEATRRIIQQEPEARVLAVTSMRDLASIQEMMEAGAVGYVLKDGDVDDLLNTIRATVAGNAVFATEVAQLLLTAGHPGAPPPDYQLTSSEERVLALVVAGLTNRQIAHQLDISSSTVKFHVRNLLAKLGVESRTEAAALAVREGLIS